MKKLALPAGMIVAFLLSGSLFFCESGHREQTLAVYSSVHVYKSEVPPQDYPGAFIAIIGPKDHVQVIKVTPRRNYLAVKVKLSDGREGWVFSGESIELYEPGCRGADFRRC